jgi:hypothetical protein
MLPLSKWKISCLSLLAIAGLSAALELGSDYDADRYERMFPAQNSSDDFGRSISIFTSQETYDDLEPVRRLEKNAKQYFMCLLIFRP